MASIPIQGSRAAFLTQVSRLLWSQREVVIEIAESITLEARLCNGGREGWGYELYLPAIVDHRMKSGIGSKADARFDAMAEITKILQDCGALDFSTKN